MPQIVFDKSMAGPAAAIALPNGGRLVDACDEAAAPVPFSCRSCSCGTCRVDVLEGAALLAPPDAEELQVLALFDDDPTKRRLACAVIVLAADGRVRVRATDDW
ncbi:MAG: 2Fe-2S iron-sulfur cluster-binding protein [Polyangiales bacterium]